MKPTNRITVPCVPWHKHAARCEVCDKVCGDGERLCTAHRPFKPTVFELRGAAGQVAPLRDPATAERVSRVSQPPTSARGDG